MPPIIQKNKVLFIIICLILVSLSTYIFSIGSAKLSLDSHDLKAFTLQDSDIEETQDENFYRDIVHNYEDDFFVLKTDTFIQFSSSQWKEKFGYEEHDVNKKNFFSFVHAKDLPFFTNSMIRVIDHGEAENNIGPFRLKSQSGEEMMYMASATPLFNKKGEIALIILVLHDVSIPIGNGEHEISLYELEEDFISMLQVVRNLF